MSDLTTEIDRLSSLNRRLVHGILLLAVAGTATWIFALTGAFCR